MGGKPLCFLYIFTLFSFSIFCFPWVLEVVTYVETAPYPFCFIFVPRIASIWKEMQLAVFYLDFCASPKTSVLSARTCGIFDIFWEPAPGYYLTFISFPLFYLSHGSASEKFIFTVSSVLRDFCLCLHLPLNLFLLVFSWEESFKISCDNS